MITIILGLAGLGLVIIFHELGHFAAARAVGVEVETFSIGWGPKLAGFRKGGTDWQISAFPIGGFCKMKGEDAFRRAMSEHLEELPRDPGSFYGATPLRRIIIALAGPAANIVFAVVVFSIVAAIGYSIRTTPARIILADEYSIEKPIAPEAGGTGATGQNPADRAGIRTGDTIVSIDGVATRDYADIQETIAIAPGKKLSLVIDRKGERFNTEVVPALDKSTGAGRIGIYSWVDPLVAHVEEGSAAAIAGILAGDTITAINGAAVRNSMDIIALLSGKPEKVAVSLLRSGSAMEIPMILSWSSTGESNFGLGFSTLTRVIRSENLGKAAVDGTKETFRTVGLTFKSIGLLFRGVDVLKAVSGPARITWMVGKATQESVQANGAAGLVTVFNFLAFLSVGLFIMNLLPIPALDGGLILMFIVEILKRKPLKAKTIMRFQFVGAAMIMGIFLLATLSDIMFFTKL